MGKEAVRLACVNPTKTAIVALRKLKKMLAGTVGEEAARLESVNAKDGHCASSEI